MTPDRYRYFRVEARDLLAQLGQGALDLEKGAAPPDAIGGLLRLAHTLKGAARVVKELDVADSAHRLEDVFAAIRDLDGRAPREQIDEVFGLLDRIGARVSALGAGPADTTAPAPAARPAPVQPSRPAAADLETLLHAVGAAQARLGALGPALDEGHRIGSLMELTASQLSRLRARHTDAGGDRDAIDRALSMVEELRSRFGSLERSLAAGLDGADRELRQVGDAAARLQLVPASTIFVFLERAARDAGRALGKPVVFEARGDVRVESGLLTLMQSALLQLIRNAVAHGIERDADERLAAGKPAEGHVSVTVTRRGPLVSFACADDGRGIDLEAVRRALLRKGLPPADIPADDPDALLRLLLAARVSTSETVTDVAGRGIGLDVVREAAARLNGRASMRSEPGQGTTVDIVVPSTMASFQALLVEAGSLAAAVPLDAVRRASRVAPDDIIASGDGDSVLHGGRGVPLVSLDRLGAGEPEVRAAGTRPVVVIEAGGGVAALGVDRVVGTGHVVTRPLPPLAPAASWVSGAALDADGRVRIVVDPDALVAAARASAPPAPAPSPARRSILVIDDSLTTRMLEQSILESAGYEVGLASSGEEAMEKARAGDYALFLVDVEMPGMDGFTFIEQARADPLLRNVPSILVTSRASAEDRERGRAAGASDYMVKSDFDQRALLERIRVLVQ